MRPNGFLIVIDLALEKAGIPSLHRYRKALILGALRENVYYLPVLGTVSLNPSISHFYREKVPGGIVPFLWPGPCRMADYHYSRAVRQLRLHRPGASFVHLGRVSHLLTDMACPVHARSVFHSTDPFEWCVEAMRESFTVSAVPDAPTAFRRAGDLVRNLARYTRHFEAEKVNNPWGALLKRFGIRKKLNTDLVRRQASELIPVAASHTASLFRLFWKDTAGVAGRKGAPENVLPEILRGLQMPERGLRKWFRHIRRFCYRHGGINHYSELLDLMDECEKALQDT